MKPVCVAFSKLNVLIIGQDDVTRQRVKGVLEGFGVPEKGITECMSFKGETRQGLHRYDLIVMDCAFKPFSRELILEELTDNGGEDYASVPVLLIVDDDVRASVEHVVADRDHVLISHSFCPKSLYLKLHLLIGKTDAISSRDGIVKIDEVLNDTPDYHIAQ